jgi:hypothetical protein
MINAFRTIAQRDPAITTETSEYLPTLQHRVLRTREAAIRLRLLDRLDYALDIWFHQLERVGRARINILLYY